MSSTKIIELVKAALTKEERETLNQINKNTDSETRQRLLKEFFTSKEVFDKLKNIFDPSWISYQIFINGKGYEF